jgi:hypothetical protein
MLPSSLEDDFGWDFGGTNPLKPKNRGRTRRGRSWSNQQRSPRLSGEDVLDDGFIAFLVEVDDQDLWDTQVPV